MKTHVLDLGVCSITLPEGWGVLSSDTDNVNAPLTIADAEIGVGALQISVATYKGGVLPNVTSTQLSELLDDFSNKRHLKDPFDGQSQLNGKCLVGQSFHDGEEFIRVWYASNGKSIVLITYVCDWINKDIESNMREMIVASMRFHDAS